MSNVVTMPDVAPDLEAMRADPRYLVHGNLLDSWIQLTGSTDADDSSGSSKRESSRHLRCELVDLSVSGARFLADAKVHSGDNLELSIHAEEIGLEISARARVSWTAPRANEWDVGCRFDEKFPDDAMDRLAAASLIERRMDPRSTLSHKARLTRASTKETAKVQFSNVSKGGFCIVSPIELGTGEALLVEFKGADKVYRVAARVQWQTGFGERFLVGCAFRNAASARAMQDFVATPRTSLIPELRAPPLIQLTRVGMLGLVFVFVYCLLWLLGLAA